MRISENVAIGCWVLAGISVAVWFSTVVAVGPAPGGAQARYHGREADFARPPASAQDPRAAAVLRGDSGIKTDCAQSRVGDACSLQSRAGGDQERPAGPKLGDPIPPAAIVPWDIDIEPSGAGLPLGTGTSAQGAVIFAEQCSACHGDDGTGATTTTSGAPAAPPVVSAVKRNGIDDTTLTIANYWPYATTLFDYVRRSMPWTSPRSLTDDQVYALTAYILAQNKLIDAQQVINAQTLPKVQMPNRDGFIPRFPELMPR